jgi:perosamine synthetase
MTNICAAIGLSQIEQVESILKRKKEIATLYQEELKECQLDFQNEQLNGVSSYWLVSILTKDKNVRDDLSNFLNKSGVETRPLFYPADTMPMFNSEGSFPVAQSLSDRGMNLPSFPDLSDEDVVQISAYIKEFLTS